jgi:hypothetical protein
MNPGVSQSQPTSTFLNLPVVVSHLEEVFPEVPRAKLERAVAALLQRYVLARTSSPEDQRQLREPREGVQTVLP